MKLRNIITSIILTFVCAVAYAQYPIIPAQPQSQAILLKGATAHIGNGQVIENASVGFRDGKLTIVAAASSQVDESGYQVIDVTGKHIYPGFIIPNSVLGLSEVGNYRQTQDQNEDGQYNPNVRSIIAYNTDSELIPTYRYNGILMAQVTPQGGTIAGSSSVVQLDAWNWEDAAYKVDEGIHMNWPSKRRGNFDFSTFTFSFTTNENYPEEVDELDALFKDAKSYDKLATTKGPNLKLEAMKGLFDGSKTLYIHSNNAKEIVEGVKFAKSHGVSKIALVTEEQAVYAAEFLKENNIPVIVESVHTTPNSSDADYDLPYRLPGLLHDAGLKVSIGYAQGSAPHLARNLMFTAGTAAGFGVDKEEALKMITLNTAEILGIADRVGSLEVGKEATLSVFEGDALDMRTSIVTQAYIQGKTLELDGMQQKIYRKYKDKYDIK